MDADEDPKTFEIVEQVVENDRKGTLGLSKSRKKQGFSREDVVNAFQRTFDMIGGVPRMALWADANPDKFYPLYTKLLPSTAIAIGINAEKLVHHAIPPSALDMHPDPETGQYTAPNIVVVDPAEEE